jgi:hypothetical protein
VEIATRLALHPTTHPEVAVMRIEQNHSFVAVECSAGVCANTRK